MPGLIKIHMLCRLLVQISIPVWLQVICTTNHYRLPSFREMLRCWCKIAGAFWPFISLFFCIGLYAMVGAAASLGGVTRMTGGSIFLWCGIESIGSPSLSLRVHVSYSLFCHLYPFEIIENILIIFLSAIFSMTSIRQHSFSCCHHVWAHRGAYIYCPIYDRSHGQQMVRKKYVYDLCKWKDLGANRLLLKLEFFSCPWLGSEMHLWKKACEYTVSYFVLFLFYEQFYRIIISIPLQK